MRTFLLFLALAASTYAQERILHFGTATRMVEEVQKMLNSGWTVKALAIKPDTYIVVLSPPLHLLAYNDRRPVPGGLEERRAKMLATKPEEEKP